MTKFDVDHRPPAWTLYYPEIDLSICDLTPKWAYLIVEVQGRMSKEESEKLIASVMGTTGLPREKILLAQGALRCYMGRLKKEGEELDVPDDYPKGPITHGDLPLGRPAE